MAQEAIFISKWKERMYELIKMKYEKGCLDKKKVFDYLDTVIKEKLNNKKVVLVNNYTNNVARADMLSLIDLIEKNNLIIGGGGCLYQPHDKADNILIHYILNKMDLRDYHKAQRKLYPKFSDEWFDFDIKQNNDKVAINMLYGSIGYFRFVLHNRFIAESITNQGRQIISTAAESFEAFLEDNVDFSTESEAYEYIRNIHNEYKENYKDKLDVSIFDTSNIIFKVTKRIVKKCKFDTSDEFIKNIENIIKNKDDVELVLLYYKNNFKEFNQNEFVKEKYRFIISELDELKKPDIKIIQRQDIVQEIKDLWDFYNVFVLYNYPIFDRVRKTMYTEKKTVLYIDTDSNFLGLNQFIKYIQNDVLNHKFNKPERETNFIAVNVLTYYLSFVVDSALKTLCKYANIPPDWASYLIMKNEFFLERIVFTDKKKRYISNAILQEGELLKGGLGEPEIKGFDFKKSTVKPFVTDYFTKICLDDILRTKDINVELIFKKMMDLKRDIEQSMRKGENKYYKQSNVQLIEYYKRPYSMPGVTGVVLWNCLCPQYQMELPTDVDLVPIKSLTLKKSNSKLSTPQYWTPEQENEYFKNENILMMKEKYPEAYRRLVKEIYMNKNENVRYMSLNYIAKPKNSNIPLPEWFEDLIDTEKVVSDILSLFYHIMTSLGVNILKTNASSTHLTNVVNL